MTDMGGEEEKKCLNVGSQHQQTSKPFQPSITVKPVVAKGLQGQTSVSVEGSGRDQQHLSQMQSRRARAPRRVPGIRAYKVKVLTWYLLVVPGEVILGFYGAVSLGSRPSFIAFLGVWPAERLSLPSQTELALEQLILLSEPAFSLETIKCLSAALDILFPSLSL